MNILVLGATGQIGYASALALSQTLHRVTVLVRDRSKLPFPPSINVLEAAEFDRQAFAEALRSIDHVVYCIGLPEQFLFDTDAFDEVNCGLLETFLEAMQASQTCRLTYISTYETFDVVDGRMDETHRIADESAMTLYSQSKLRAYRRVVAFAEQNGIQLTTLHPAAVYGGLSTGDGVTTFMENLAAWRVYRVPFMPDGQFPVVHVDSLTDCLIRSLDATGAYIVSDAMTSLQEIARTMRQHARVYQPLVAPLGVVKFGVFAMEGVAELLPIKPLFSSVQIEFITRGWIPDAAKAIRDLQWRPMPLWEGCRRYLQSRRLKAPFAGAQISGPAASAAS